MCTPKISKFRVSSVKLTKNLLIVTFNASRCYKSISKFIIIIIYKYIF